MYDFFKYLPTFIRNNNPIKYLSNRITGNKFLNKPPIDVSLYSDTEVVDIEIYVVAFNNPQLIENHILYLNKNCLDKYKLIIADNSSDPGASKEIKELCKKNRIDYIKLPKNKKLELSRSHGYSLNYLMKHFILKSKVPYFGLLDHDCFLIRPTSFIEKLKEYGMWGASPQDHSIKIGKYIINGAGNRRFIWPGCSFFKKELFKNGYDFTPNKRLIPISFLDTGGGNRKYVYKYFKGYDKKVLIKRIRCGEYEMLDDMFFHIEGAGHRGKDKVNKYISYLHKTYQMQME